jgi:hypothetical protein
MRQLKYFKKECLELQAKANQKSVSVTALAFPGDSVNNFVVGSEDGIIYSGQRHANKKVCLNGSGNKSLLIIKFSSVKFFFLKNESYLNF